MTKDEALKLALDFLEQGNFVYPTSLATSIREALAQTEQQPNHTEQRLEIVGQPEPVAWLYIDPDNPHLNVHCDDVDVSQFPHDEWFPVYKAQPKREWLELMRGVRVEGDTVVIKVSGGNEAARGLCSILIEEMNK